MKLNFVDGTKVSVGLIIFFAKSLSDIVKLPSIRGIAHAIVSCHVHIFSRLTMAKTSIYVSIPPQIGEGEQNVADKVLSSCS